MPESPEKRKKAKSSKKKTKKTTSAIGVEPTSSKRPLPPDTSLHIVMNPKQVYKDDVDATYRLVDLKKFALITLPQKLAGTLTVIPTRDKKSRTNMFREYGNFIIEFTSDKKNQFCQIIDMDFLEESLRNCNAILMLMDSSETIVGFTTLYFLLDTNSIYIDIICSNLNYKGGGNQMISKIKDMGHALDMDAIELSSLTEAIPFYIGKEQFECNDLCPLVYNIRKRKARKTEKKRAA
jgi:hypothetical protein